MKWISLLLAIITLFVKITEILEKKGLISKAEADLVRRIVERDKELTREINKARNNVKRDADAGGLRDDDGFRRD